MRGSPHINAPELSHESKDDYIQFVDHHVQAYLPDTETDPGLYELVETYQKHSYSKTCKKYKNRNQILTLVEEERDKVLNPNKPFVIHLLCCTSNNYCTSTFWFKDHNMIYTSCCFTAFFSSRRVKTL